MSQAVFRDRVFRSLAAELEVMADYDEVLADWPVAHDIDVVPTVLGQTAVVSSGPPSAPSLVLLHGAGTNAMSWASDIGTFATRFRTHVVDIPGDPGRSAGIVADRRSPVYARWLGDVLDGLDIGRAHLVGISMGAWNAVTFAVARPQRVRSLTLLAPDGICQPRPRFFLSAAPLMLLGSAGSRRIDRWIAGGRLVRQTLSYVDRLSRSLRPRIDITPLFTDDELRSLRMPILAVTGARDVIFAAHRVARRLRLLVPRARIVVLPRDGHALIGLAAPVVGFIDGAPGI